MGGEAKAVHPHQHLHPPPSTPLQLRSQRVELARLGASLEASRQAEAGQDAAAASLRRQLAALRAELASVGDALAASQERCSRAEGDLRRESEALAQSREALAAEVGPPSCTLSFPL